MFAGIISIGCTGFALYIMIMIMDGFILILVSLIKQTHTASDSIKFPFGLLSDLDLKGSSIPFGLCF